MSDNEKATAETPVPTVRDGDISGSSATHENTPAINAFRGNSGISEMAARADHSHPVNVDASVVPLPVGLVAQLSNATRLILSKFYQCLYGVGGYPNSGGVGCNTYALANHSHAYAFVSAWRVGIDDDYWHYSLPDGYEQNSAAGYQQEGKDTIRKVMGNSVRGTYLTLLRGHQGLGWYPARENHSHALNVADLQDSDARSGTRTAADFVKPVGSGTAAGGAADPAVAGFGESPYYARVDHVHPDRVVFSGSSTPPSLLPIMSVEVRNGLLTQITIQGVTIDKTGRIVGTNGNPSSADISNFPGFGSSAPGTDTSGGSAGSGTTAARADHRHPLNVDATAPAPAGGTANAGSATTYARRDHVHAVKFGTNNQGRLVVITGASDGTAGVDGDAIGNGNAVLAGKTDIQVLAALAKAISKIDTATGAANFKSSEIYDPGCTSNGNCLAYFKDDKTLAHLGTGGMTVEKLQALADALLWEPQTGGGVEPLLDYARIYCGDDSAPTSAKAIGFEAGSDEASLLDVSVLAPAAGAEGASAANAPLPEVAPANPETAAAKIARIGTSEYAARADHIHPICTEMGTAVDKSMPASEGDTLPSGVALDTTTWTPGANGYVESYCCRVVKSTQGAVSTRLFIFRQRKISKTGSVVWVGPEYVGFQTKY